MQTESYINSGKIRALHPILKSWINTTLEYLKYFDEPDCSWWYNERASLSSFAAAVWKVGGIALEEYAIDKGKEHELWTGRCDLFMGLKSDQFACEAKQAWCPIGRTAKNGIVNLKKGLTEACKDARKLPKEEGRRLGICFAVPYLPPRDNKVIEKQLKNWLNSICNSIDYDAISWLFPPKIRGDMKTVNGFYYPGTVLIIKEIHRQVKKNKPHT